VDVSPDHIQQIESIAGDHRLSLVLLFGSAVTGQGEHQGSDLDIAVRYSGKVPAFNEQYQLIRQLQELKIYAFKRYQDHRPYFVMERAFVDRFVQGADTPSSD
jgi:predicted nucleotidyltransferase